MATCTKWRPLSLLIFFGISHLRTFSHEGCCHCSSIWLTCWKSLEFFFFLLLFLKIDLEAFFPLEFQQCWNPPCWNPLWMTCISILLINIWLNAWFKRLILWFNSEFTFLVSSASSSVFVWISYITHKAVWMPTKGSASGNSSLPKVTNAASLQSFCLFSSLTFLSVLSNTKVSKASTSMLISAIAVWSQAQISSPILWYCPKYR